MMIRAARNEDLDAIKVLLAENGLPASDVTPDLLRSFAVAENAAGSVVGSVGLERFGTDALLRSLAVAKLARNCRLGGDLVAHAEDLARASGVGELWLLTTTAADFFPRVAYARVDRGTAPAELQGSTQFSQLCPASAVCFKKAL
ncbi:arsenic resistance N-acetyltransferase ArsN2 [Paraburkholderia aromaticivorans]|uniref:GNAT family N-acetyltransferase n=1 Tax=Paraburkholderia aromaticivorans TaxID=2026199 RepID=A0A248VCF9_9BURK|nr:arsenic resistance N-acetyltransferase ArsN2 [Paraburkholderia aromaticivorans]ASV96745.1 GNAT family N-acetyltransferase [Paraburkholderia aromaticivorans]